MMKVLNAPYDQLRKMENLRHNAERQARFPNMEPNHKVFIVPENVNREVLEVFTEQDGVRELPFLVYEQVLLGVVHTVYIQIHVNWIYRLHNECRNDTNLFDSNDVKNGVYKLVQFAGSVENGAQT